MGQAEVTHDSADHSEVGDADDDIAASAALAEQDVDLEGSRVTLVLQDGPLAFYRNSMDLALHVGLPSEGSLSRGSSSITGSA